MDLNLESELEARAAYFAIGAHESMGQKRKYGNQPYWIHPYRVVQILKQYHFDEEVYAAAWMHDVVEDVDLITNDVIRFHYGKRVAALVAMVTDISRKPEDGSRENRKRIDREHLARADRDGQSIKLADIIDNTGDISENDPKFAKRYIEEKNLLLKVLTKGHEGLYKQAQANI